MPLLFLLLLSGRAPAKESPLSYNADTVALRVVERFSSNITEGGYAIESLTADLYVKELVKSEQKNLLLNIVPGMTRFDRDEDTYLAELFYKVYYMHNSLPEIKRVCAMSTFRHGSGEMELLLSFMVPNMYNEYLFGAEHLSPLFYRNHRYYIYDVDTTYMPPGHTKVLFKSKYDNMHLLKSGWVVVDDMDGMPVAFYGKGSDVQCDFAIECNMGSKGVERALVKSIDLSVDYRFAFNKLKITAQAEFDYTMVQPMMRRGELERKLNITMDNDTFSLVKPVDRFAYASAHRKVPLTFEDSLLYSEKDKIPKKNAPKELVNTSESNLKSFLWQVGDGVISSHTLAWGNSDLRLSPLIKPSYISYSSSRGLSYKLSINFRTLFSRNNMLHIRPIVGYSSKLREFYWNLHSSVSFLPMKRAMVTIDIGRDLSAYNYNMFELLELTPVDTLGAKTLSSFYYRDFYVKPNYRMEVLNGLEVMAGVNFYLRTMSDTYGYPGVDLKKEYKQVASYMRVTWHPGMFYYVNDGKKVNLGSNRPRLSLDVEYGVKDFLGSEGEYTRAELDFQYRYRVSPGGVLYMRLGCGGYFHTRDIYFVNYTFLKDNHFSIVEDSELDGEFHLLDRVWYNSANKYVRANFSYSSPFMVLQKIIPSASFIKRESLYGGLLFISSLTPYAEYGYGIETPYVNVGVFVGFEKGTYHKIGAEISFSLFRD